MDQPEYAKDLFEFLKNKTRNGFETYIFEQIREENNGLIPMSAAGTIYHTIKKNEDLLKEAGYELPESYYDCEMPFKRHFEESDSDADDEEK